MSNRAAASVSVFTVSASSGQLTAVAGSPFAAELTPASAVMIHPDGRFLFVPHRLGEFQNRGRLLRYSIDQGTGALAPLAALETFKAADFGFDHSGRHLYGAYDDSFAGAPGRGLITAELVDAAGALSAINSVIAVPSGFRALALHPTGSFIYGYAHGRGVYTYGIDTNGALADRYAGAWISTQGSFIVPSLPAPVAPPLFSSKFAFVANAGDNTTGYRRRRRSMSPVASCTGSDRAPTIF